MSSSLPPGPPPSSPPPSGPPPGGETLEYGGGGPIPPDRGSRRGGRKRLFLIGGALIGLGAVGGAAFGAWWYLSTGPQPAEALPAGTLGYVSVDLDPSGEQKIDALRTLKKFPAAENELDLGGDLGDIDIKKVLVEQILASAPCDLDYGDDVEPWLGDRGAVAAVDVGGEEPAPVFVLQVTDADAAKDGVADLISCDGGESEEPGMEIVGDEWMVLAETPEIAGDVADATEKGSLADDETFQKWTEAAGDPGILTMYAAPAAGAFLAENLEGLFGVGAGLGGMETSALPGSDFCGELPSEAEMPDGVELGAADEELLQELDEMHELTCETSQDDAGDPSVDAMTDELTTALKDFEGAAVSLRFDGGAVEVEVAGDPGMYGEGAYSGDTGADALGSLPGDTAAAFGIGLEDGWFDDVLASAASSLGEDGETLVQELEEASGLALPEDAETLLGDSAAISVGGDIDPEALSEMDDPSGLPLALKVLGDPDAVEEVLDKIRPQLGADGDLLASASEGDAIAVGPNRAYLDQVLQDGDLGESDSYRSVVPDGDDVAAVLFVDLDRIAGLIVEGMGDDGELADNLEPLDALGMSAWEDDGVSHARLRLSTD